MASLFIAIIVMLVTAFSATPVLAQSPEPLEIEGEPMTNLVTSHPLPTTFAVTSSSGVYVGNGSSWSPIKASVAAATHVWGGDESTTWLAGEAPDCMMGGGTRPMQRSDDNGATWADIRGTEGLSPLGLWPTTGAALAAGCAGVFGSRDHGQTWAAIPELPAGFEVTSAGEVLTGDSDHHVVLLGLTGEGGTSSIYVVDLSDPQSPVVTPDLRTYYAVGGLRRMG